MLPLVVLLVVFVVFQLLYHVLWRVAASTMMTLAASCKCCTHHSFEFLPHYFDGAWLRVQLVDSRCRPVLPHRSLQQPSHASCSPAPGAFDLETHAAIPSPVKVDAIVNHVVKPNVFQAYCAGLRPEDFATRRNDDADAPDGSGDALASLQTPRRSSVVANPAVMSL